MNGIEIAITIFVTLAGLCVGSFINVLIYRLPNNMNIATPRSHCPKCKSPIKWYDNIPVISYIWLGGKCRNCSSSIPITYPVVELMNCFVWVMALYAFSNYGWLAVTLACITLSCFIAIFFIDAQHKIIPDSLNLVLLLVGITYMIFLKDMHWIERLVGGAASFALFSMLYYGSQLIIGREGLGGGDVKLVGAAGLILGWQNMILVLFLSSLAACIYYLFAGMAKKADRETPFAFAPFLTASMAIMLFLGSFILQWYLGLFAL